MALRPFFFDDRAYKDYAAAMRKFKRALRHGDIRLAQTWLAIAERCMRLQTSHDGLVVSEEKREAWLAEQPHRQKALEIRSRFGR